MTQQYRRGSDQLRKTLELYPDWMWAWTLLAWNEAFGGTLERSSAAARRAEQLMSRGELVDYWALASLAFIYASAGLSDEALRIQSELEQLAETGYMDPFNFGVIAAGLGEYDRALDCLEESYEVGSNEMAYLQAVRHTWFREVSDHPRFVALLGRLRFPS